MSSPIRAAWVGETQPPLPLEAIEFAHVATADLLLRQVDEGRLSPQVLVTEWSRAESTLSQVKAHTRLRTVPLIVVGPRDDDLPWRAAQAGAFCCTEPEPGPLMRAIAAAARSATGAPPWLNDTAKTARVLLQDARFELRSPFDAEALAHFVAAGLDDPPRRVTGLLELFLNAIEHGNLGIDGPTKHALLMSGDWEREINRRLATAPYRDRVVQVQVTTSASGFVVRIEDQGDGFDAGAYVTNPSLTGAGLRGRGIALAKLISFDDVTYEGRGNCVVAMIRSGGAR